MRFTFSLALARFLCSYDDSFSYRRFKFNVGEVASAASENCVFAIVSYTGAVLRMATTYDRAEILADNENRFVFEARIKLK